MSHILLNLVIIHALFGMVYLINEFFMHPEKFIKNKEDEKFN